MNSPAIKVVVVAKSLHLLALQLRKLASEIEEGHYHMNVMDGEGMRMMRPVKQGEPTFYLDVRDML